MELIGLKLILIIIIVAIIGGLIGYLIAGGVYKKEKTNIAPFVYSRITPDQFFGSFYDKERTEFKTSKTSPVSLSATYYALSTFKKGMRPGFGDEVISEDIEKIFDKIRSYYTSVGYYLEENVNSVFSTSMVLQIASYFPQSLNQEIDLNWLKSNSLGNESLEQDKFDPEYQKSVLEIYKNINNEEAKSKIQELGPAYISYYCTYNPGEVSDSEYLRRKYYQVAIISYLTNVERVSSEICFRAKDIEADKTRLSNISFQNLEDIKELFWLYSLNKFYNIKTSQNAVYTRMEKFYSNKEFKERLTDDSPNLVGMFYGSIIHSALFGRPL